MLTIDSLNPTITNAIPTLATVSINPSGLDKEVHWWIAIRSREIDNVLHAMTVAVLQRPHEPGLPERVSAMVASIGGARPVGSDPVPLHVAMVLRDLTAQFLVRAQQVAGLGGTALQEAVSAGVARLAATDDGDPFCGTPTGTHFPPKGWGAVDVAARMVRHAALLCDERGAGRVLQDAHALAAAGLKHAAHPERQATG